MFSGQDYSIFSSNAEQENKIDDDKISTTFKSKGDACFIGFDYGKYIRVQPTAAYIDIDARKASIEDFFGGKI